MAEDPKITFEQLADEWRKLNVEAQLDAALSKDLVEGAEERLKINKDLKDASDLHRKISMYIKENEEIESEIKHANDKLEMLDRKIEESEADYKSLDIALEIKKDEHEEYLSNLAFEKEKYLDLFNDIKKKHDKLLKDFDEKTEELESNTEYVNGQIKGLNHLVEERQNKCIELDAEISNKKDDIKRAEFQAEKIEEEAKARVSEIKNKYKAWKTNVLAEMAKIQLKNKIDTIDKAGLSEILNG